MRRAWDRQSFSLLVSANLNNLGIPAGELDQVEDIQIPGIDALDLDPDLITLWPGPNDMVDGTSIEEFASDLDSIVDTLLSETNAIIVLGTIPDLRQVPRFQENPTKNVTAARIAAYNEIIIRQNAKDSRVRIADLRQTEVTEELVNDADGFHPNDRGYDVMADIFLAVIRPEFCPQEQ